MDLYGGQYIDKKGTKQDRRELIRSIYTYVVILGLRDKRTKERRAHQHLAIHDTLPHVICTTELWDRNLHTHFIQKPMKRGHNGV